MEIFIERWKEFQLSEGMAGMSEKERERERHKRRSSEKIRKSMGASEELIAGEKDMAQLAHGIYEDEDELDEAQPWHDPETGKFSSPKKGAVYSISKDGARRSGIDSKFAFKGISTGNKREDGTTKTQSKFTMASGDKACGRTDVQKTGRIPYRKSCSKYPKDALSEEEVIMKDGCPMDGTVSTSYVRGVVQQELDQAVKEIAAVVQRARTTGGKISIGEITPTIRSLALSLKGKTAEEGKP
tara:strand:+ start:510 stop:1235 length:726 start_codon:yes stop_codon:yes gene_type:complete